MQKFLPMECTVIRDGKDMNVPADRLVVGDIVRLSEGNKVTSRQNSSPTISAFYNLST